jgi:mRNA-degrading endonuclease RelE of RelBE toxin-antitoxin system
MDFRIADTFTDSLARLSSDEQKMVKMAAFDLQLNPATPGMSFHRLDKARDKSFWSVRVNNDVRLIVHRTEASLLLCYVAHHDAAYQWAERRRLETHPTTGAAQLVELRERVEEIRVPRIVAEERETKRKLRPFAELPDAVLLRYGVPVEWLAEVRLATEDGVLDLADHLPGEAAEALLDLAVGEAPSAPNRREPSAHYQHRVGHSAGDRPTKKTEPSVDPFEHPDAQRRFRTIRDVEELERALDYPWEKWTIFLHPTQRDSVERDYSGPARIAGSAGTGKTIVALHRAVFLARKHPDARVLLTTFSEALATNLRTRLRRLIGNEPRIAERIDVYALNAIGIRLYELNLGKPKLASEDLIRELVQAAALNLPSPKPSLRFLVGEWEDVVDAWNVETWEGYRDMARLGRKARLAERQRRALWTVFEQVRTELKARGLVTQSQIFSRLAAHFAPNKRPPFDFVVVDEAQDLSVAQLRFLAAIGASRPNALFFTGDLGQRIFQQPFSWKALGVDVRGRSRTLRINYRTSHQIRSQADRLLGKQVADVDGNVEDRSGAISVFNGPPPVIRIEATLEAESETVGRWLSERMAEGVQPHEIGVFVRSTAELARAQVAIKSAGLAYKLLDDTAETTTGHAALATMHLAKGLEFRAVAVMACDDEVIPLQERIAAVSDDADLEEIYNTERHLLYVACTRARDYLLVTGVKPGSEFLEDLAGVGD